MSEPKSQQKKAGKGDGSPSNDNNGAAETASETLPANAEDRAAAVALSSLNAPTTAEGASDAGEAGGEKGPSVADQEALGKAMNRLEMIAGGGGGAAATGAGAGAGKKATTSVDKTAKAAAQMGDAAKTSEEGKPIKKKPVVKVAADDVNLLVNQLDLTKIKATELLKEHDGDVAKAVRAFIVPTTTPA